MTDPFYWIVFAIATLVCLIAVPYAIRYERRKARELWNRMYAKPHGPQYERDPKGWPGPPFDFEADARWHDHA